MIGFAEGEIIEGEIIVRWDGGLEAALALESHGHEAHLAVGGSPPGLQHAAVAFACV